MRGRVYRSKVSPVLVGILILILPVNYIFLWEAWESGNATEIAVGTVLVTLLSIVVLGSLNTRYWIDSSVLHIRSFVFRWRIPVDTIIRITHSDSLGASWKAGLSTDMITIWHRRGSVAISPRRRADFLADLGKAREAHGLEPVRGVRA
ncbi:MAG: PH domain-containing protein [Gammaproteobacteria bacterium]|nr:PH domain-containing protein [Gammaproteobacteria bacterium]